jgi:hypothetical protein
MACQPRQNRRSRPQTAHGSAPARISRRAACSWHNRAEGVPVVVPPAEIIAPRLAVQRLRPHQPGCGGCPSSLPFLLPLPRRVGLFAFASVGLHRPAGLSLSRQPPRHPHQPDPRPGRQARPQRHDLGQVGVDGACWGRNGVRCTGFRTAFSGNLRFPETVASLLHGQRSPLCLALGNRATATPAAMLAWKIGSTRPV